MEEKSLLTSSIAVILTTDGRGQTLLFTLLFGGKWKNDVCVQITGRDWLDFGRIWVQQRPKQRSLGGTTSIQKSTATTNITTFGIQISSQSRPVICTHTSFFHFPPNNNVNNNVCPLPVKSLKGRLFAFSSANSVLFLPNSIGLY